MRNLILAGAVLAALASSRGDLSTRATGTSTESRNKAAIERSLTAWKNGTGSPYDLLADDASWTIVGRSIASKS